jgi:O-antigen/teichoic acid export membrane protein
MTTVRRALLLSFVERYLMLVVALASNLLLARLLTPEQIGVFSVSLAVIGVAQAVRDFGVGNYLIQETELGPEKVATAFTISLAIGLTLFVLVALLAPTIAAWYGEPRMAVTLRIVSLNFLMMPFGTVCLSLLRRKMQFRLAMIANLVASVAGAVTSVLLAWLGVGENSLAWGGVVSQGGAAAIAWWLVRAELPLRVSWTRWREIARFGGMSSASGIITSVSMDANDLVVGKVLGFEPVAMLSRAQGLSYLVHRDLLGAVRNVALPALSKAHREGADLGAQFTRGVANLTVLAWICYGWLACFSLEAVSLLYGSQWLEAVPLVPVFCLAGALGAINVITPNLLIAVGAVRTMMVLDLFLQPLRLALIAAAAMWFGTIEACAWAFCLAAAVSVPAFWVAKRNKVHEDGGHVLRLAGRSLLVAFVTVLPAFATAVSYGLDRSQPLPIWMTLSCVLVGLILGAVMLFWTRHPLSQEPLVAKLCGRLLRRAAD